MNTTILKINDITELVQNSVPRKISGPKRDTVSGPEENA
jgi:hypothetical protein